MIIRYRGGPLNRRTYTGPSEQPPYRDRHGNILDRPRGRGVTGTQLAEAFRRAAYVYDPQKCEYIHRPDLFVDSDNARITELMERIKVNPYRADQYEAEIRQIEARSAQ